MNSILQKLIGGDFRSIGKSNEVVAIVLSNPLLFPELFAGLFVDDPLVRMRAADSIEKITLNKPELLQKYKRQIFDKASLIEQQEVQWHIAQIIPRLKLSKSDMAKALKILDSYLKTTKSNIVCVMSLQALAELAMQGTLNIDEIIKRIKIYAKQVNTPSVTARSRKLIKMLESPSRKTA